MLNKLIISLQIILVCLFASMPATAQEIGYTDSGNMNPLVPGYFADPTVIKVDDTYYMYATTDGVRLASGEPQIWISKDFVHWYNQEIDIPTELTNIWAPDVVISDNKYYYFHGNCEAGCNIYGYQAEDPLGPWASINSGNPLFTPESLGGLPALDQHYFLDDDGSMYVYYGTWISSFTGLGWAKVDTSDMITILDKGFIPKAELPDVFEAPFMLKRNGKYIMMYSSGDCQASSYRVQYAYSDSPTGPFTFGANNPILSTNSDGTVDGPGHHSILKEEDDYYIIYHRHDNPHSGGGEFRQLCIDSLIFDNDSTIRKVVPTHEGIGLLGENQITQTNHAYNAVASATSVYHLVNGNTDYIYHPAYASDENNGTMWRAGTNDLPQHLTLDLNTEINIKRVMTQFEYSTYYYQYTIEYSSDSTSWAMFANRTANKESGSPMIDDGDVTARYLRITITSTEKTGIFAAIWNIKVYSELFDIPALTPEISEAGPGTPSTKSMLVEVNAANLSEGLISEDIPNTGTLGSTFSKKGNPEVDIQFKVKTITFDGNDYLKLNTKAPLSLSWNSSFTISAWVLNPKVTNGECLVVWSKRTDNLMGEYAALMYGTNVSYGAVAHWGRLDMPYTTVPEANRWHHIVLTFDGMIEKIYVDSVLDNQSQRNLFIHPNCDIIVGFSGESSEYLRGSIASLRMYDKCFPEDSIGLLMRMDELDIDYNYVPPELNITPSRIEESMNIYYNHENESLIIDNNQNAVQVDNIRVLDLSGRTLWISDHGLKNQLLEIQTPDIDSFIVTVTSDSEVYSKLIVKY